MKIYTKTGDTGQSSLYGGKRVSKDDIRLEAYGTIDELNSTLGLVISGLETKELENDLRNIQSDLFRLGSELAVPAGQTITGFTPLDNTRTIWLEQAMDKMSDTLPPLKSFILPGGTKLAAYLHLARTVCRRAERRVVNLASQETIRPEIITYLNRLADYLFVLARFANTQTGVVDIPWQS